MNKKAKKSVLYLMMAFLSVLFIAAFFSYLFFLYPGKNITFSFNPDSSYWPTHGWKISTPEQQGMDSEVLARIFDKIKEKSWFRKKIHTFIAKQTKELPRDSLNIKGVLIIRNGYIVLEANIIDDKSFLHPIYSSTKSFISAIFGIALSKGQIKGIDQNVLSFFPEFEIQNLDFKKESMTLKHLLCMSSGFEWPELGSNYYDVLNPVNQMSLSDDWAEFALNKPVILEPGRKFNYNSGCSQILTAILHKQTGKNLTGFVQKNLFEPLGITRYRWERCHNGVLNGSHGLNMTLRDMAKFGYLFLKGGSWDGQQIIPKKWIEESTKRQIKRPGRQGWFIPFYGYQWYVHSFGFHSLGSKGQYIVVLPEFDIVVVFASNLARHETFEPLNLVKQFVIKSVKSKTALPDNPDATALLRLKLNDF